MPHSSGKNSLVANIHRRKVQGTSRSKKNVLRGLHMQTKKKQGKFVSVLKGAILDVAVDLRKNSKTFGKHFKIDLTEKNGKSIFIPPGFAHGFLAREKENIVKNTKAVLFKAIKFGGSSIRDFEGISGKTGSFQHEFMAYNREGQLCRKPKCNGKIKKIYISNRSTFYCSKCQR